MVKVARFLLAMLLVPVALGVVGCEEDGAGKLLKGMTPAEHDRYFPIVSGKHGGVECNTCHGGFETFREFTCLDCHEHDQPLMDSTHQGFTDYKWESPRCYGCHPRGNVLEEIDHERYFPIREGTAHEAIACATCHVDPSNRKVVGCTSCHEHAVVPMAAVHNGMPEYAWDSPTCLTCHPQGERIGLLDHSGFFPIASPATHSAENNISCADCHMNPTDRQDVTCIACHEHDQQPMADTHAGVPDYLWESGSCLMCHPNSEHDGQINHDRFFPIGDGAAHATVSCTECHVNPDSRLDVSCTTCHDHAQDAMATTHSGVPGYAWDSPSCLFCHPGSEPVGNIDHSAYFPIEPPATHSSDNAIGCTSCHTNANDRGLVACITCHDHEQAPMSTIHNGIPSYAWDTASCLACHPGGEPVGAIDHTFFPISGQATHNGLSCRDCHTDRADRSVLGCTSCHDHAAEPMEVIHHGMPGYAWTSNTCLTCHPSGQPTGLLDHSSFFPIAVGDQHAGVSCAECHAERADRSRLLCTTCHEQQPTGVIHNQVPDYLWESSSCYMCHPNADPVGNINHNYFPIDPPAVHQGISCAECHTNPATRADVGCIECHQHEQQATNAIHGGVPGYQYLSSACLLCHPNAEPTGNIDHEPLFPIAAPAAHEAVTCVECHTNPNNRQELGCATCHTPQEVDPFHQGIPGFAHTSPACVSCHPRANKPGLMDHDPFFPINAADTHGGVSCTECHASRTDRSQLSCTSCHAHQQADMATVHAAVPGFVFESTMCVTCHPQGQAAGAFDHTPFFPIATGDTHAGISCAECHTNPSNTGELGCITCHAHQQADMATVHAVVPGYAYESQACLSCHPNGEAIGVVDHTQYFPIGINTEHEGIGCAQCHINSADLTQNGCRECHVNETNLPTVHANVGEFRQNSNQPSPMCKKCHAEAQVNRTSLHQPFRITSGPHSRKPCFDCHINTRSDKPWAADFSRHTCWNCHEHNLTRMADKHRGENGYNAQSPNCIGCHPSGND